MGNSFLKPVSKKSIGYGIGLLFAIVVGTASAQEAAAPATPVPAVPATTEAPQNAAPAVQAPATDSSGKQDMQIADNSPLVQAIIKHDEQGVRDHITSINDKTVDGSYPIIVCAQQGTAVLAQIMTANGADVHVLDSHHRNALHYAAMRGDVEQVKLLMALNVQATALDDDGISPLFYALLNKHLAAANELKTSASVDVNQPGADGAPLAFRVVNYKDRPKVVQWMIDHKLNIVMRNAEGKSLMDVTKAAGFEESYKLLQSTYEQTLRNYIEKQKALEAQKNKKLRDE